MQSTTLQDNAFYALELLQHGFIPWGAFDLILNSIQRRTTGLHDDNPLTEGICPVDPAHGWSITFFERPGPVTLYDEDYDDPEMQMFIYGYAGIGCAAGCSQDEILAALNLTWETLIRCDDNRYIY
jgi:hypothetical protein